MAKLNISVDLSDLFFEERSEEGYVEFNVNDMLKGAILDQVKSSVRDIVSAQVKQAVSDFCQADLNAEVRAMMKATVIEFMASKELPERYGNKVTVNQYLESRFESEVGQRGALAENVSKLAEKWGASLKAQYDAAFATKIVDKLNKEGLLMPNVAMLLLSKD